MELYELREKKEDLDADIRYYSRELLRLRLKVEPGATDYSKDMVQSSPRSNDEALAELAQISLDLDNAIKKLENINSLASDKYNIYKKFNDYDKQIYAEKKLFKWSNAKISARHNGLSKSQIYRIVDKVENMGKKGKL